jgi:hypothetical protein
MDDLLDEAQEYGHNDDGLECLSEDDEEYANAEQILGSHFVGERMDESAWLIYLIKKRASLSDNENFPNADI